MKVAVTWPDKDGRPKAQDIPWEMSEIAGYKLSPGSTGNSQTLTFETLSLKDGFKAVQALRSVLSKRYGIVPEIFIDGIESIQYAVFQEAYIQGQKETMGMASRALSRIKNPGTSFASIVTRLEIAISRPLRDPVDAENPPDNMGK